MRQIYRRVLQIAFAWLFCFVAATANAQNPPIDNYGALVGDAQIEEWLGRESRLDHPVIDGLETQDAEQLHFYFERNYAQRAQAVIRTAHDARQKSLRFLPPEAVENIHIYLLGDINRYFREQGSQGGAPEWAAGLTILRDGVILIKLAPRGTSRIEPEMTLAHELNHVALRRIARDAYFPHWFYEGLAMTTTDDWNINRAEVLARASMAGKLFDLDGIDDAFGKIGATVELAYAESAHFVSWLAKENGDESIKKLIEQTANGQPFDAAFSDIYGRSPRAAFALWHDQMSRDRSLFANVFSPEGIFFIISVFAAIALTIALIRRTSARKQRLAAMAREDSLETLPENLRNFGPFTHSNKK